MKKTQDKTNYFFVDESGDTTFYDRKGNLILDKEGVSNFLMIGFIKTEQPSILRKSLSDLREEISKDPYLQGIPSISKSLLAFHAKDDCPEVREKVFKLISTLDFSAEIYFARKKEKTFNNTFHRKETEFYDYLITKLFENKLHLATKNYIYFAVRGNSTRQKPLEQAIARSIELFEKKYKVKNGSEISVQAQTPSGEPCLQIIDYISWAIQRVYTNSEMRFYKTIESKVKYLVDLYDTDKYPNNYYSKTNPFDVKKISPLQTR